MTADEVAAMEKKQAATAAGSGQENVDSGKSAGENPSPAQKRKSGEVNDDNANSTKKAKTGGATRSTEGSDRESAEPTDEDG